MEGRERFGAEALMPKVSGKDVEKANGRKNRAGQCFLNFDVAIDDFGVAGQTSGNEALDVTPVKIFVESYAIEPRCGVKGFELAERRGRARENGSGKPEKDAQ